MGEISDAMVDGEICTICCCPFEEEYGYPLACEECGGDGVLAKPPEERETHEKE